MNEEDHKTQVSHLTQIACLQHSLGRNISAITHNARCIEQGLASGEMTAEQASALAKEIQHYAKEIWN